MERLWTTLERRFDRLARLHVRLKPFNPLYYLGQLSLLLLIILTVTGVYLTIFYRPGADRAYQSVLFISANWFGRLMRTSHRYASDALIVTILLHALKMLLSDRFWGSRWLAWVTGWALLALTWSLGVMGYWLIWDEPAQWLTEWLTGIVGGPLAYSFLGPNLNSATFAMFVIVLFLHAFIPPLVGAGVLVHVLRLARAKYWTPLWLTGVTVLALLLLSLLVPVGNELPARFSTLVTVARLDWLYLGFLPTAEWLGTPITWILTILLVAMLTALPWLARGRHDGPALVIPAACTGCGACVRECPYGAIDLLQRDDDTEFSSLALVKPVLCTGCGICVGSCPDRAIELERLPSPVVRQDLQRRLGQIARTGEPAVTIYLCDRHQALGTLPPLLPAAENTALGGTIPLLEAKLPPRINVGQWPDGAGRNRPVMIASVPCTGMLHPNWASETLAAGGAGAIVISCPAGDCANREGPHWIGKRLTRRRTLRQGNTHFLEVAPGSKADVHMLWTQMVGDTAQAAAAREDLSTIGRPKASLPDVSPWRQLRHLLPGFLLLLAVLGVALLPTWRVNRPVRAEASLRLVLNHTGQRLSDASDLPPEIADKLPPNVDPATVLGGQRFPVGLRLYVDGALVLERQYEAGGWRNEGAIFAVEEYGLAPGSHRIIVELTDDGGSWQEVFASQLAVDAGTAATLIWQAAERQFSLSIPVGAE